MSKTLIFTDIHITEPGGEIIGLDPLQRFRTALDHALTHHPDADRIVFLGDLTHHGRVAQYDALRKVLAALPLPVSLTLGNHDNRAAFASVFGSDHLTDGFAHSAWDQDGTLFLLLDTVDEDGMAPKHGGYLCEARLQWARDQIAAVQPKRIIAMMHHPPVATGFPGMGQIDLKNGQDCLSLLRSTGLPCHMLCGHVHRTISGNVAGLPFSLLKGTCHQMPMALEETGTSMSVAEPGAYGIVLVRGDTVIVHSEDVFDTPADVMLDSYSG